VIQMYSEKKIKIIVTLGPSTNTEKSLRNIKDRGVDFARINMSHSSIEDLKHFVSIAKKVGIPFIIDTEGSQIRTGDLVQDKVEFEEADIVKIYTQEVTGDKEKICLKPASIAGELKPGDLIFVDFNTLVLKVSDTSTVNKGYICTRVVTNGSIGRNKSAVIISGCRKKFKLPVLTEKDKKSIELGLKEGIGHIALSFVREGKDVDEVKKTAYNSMFIISKIESKESLENIDEIIEKSDALLLDRGDLSKEVPVEKIPFIQKGVLKKAQEKGKPVFIATNLLESMVENKKPTRAEVNDVMNTILDGADGLVLSAETAVGKHPIGCINMMNKIVKHSKLIEDIDFTDYLSGFDAGSLTKPHGGRLIERFTGQPPENLEKLLKIKLTEEQQMDIEQIAIGTFSPLEGFMCKNDFQSVLDNMRLSSGVIWPVPIVLDVSEKDAMRISVGDDLALVDDKNEIAAVFHIKDKYGFDKKETINKLYCTDDENHPGVRMVMRMKPVLLGGKIDLLKRRESEYREYELTPWQVRKLFEDRNWVKIAGFHSRNAIHRGHEFIQLKAIERRNCDGLFIQPVIGKKKPGDFNAKYTIKAYERMMKDIYPKNSVVFAVFSTYSRYAGPREAIFTALCRKNFGCSHFIVGRDHTGVGNYYHPKASHQIFDKFPDLGIEPIKFNKVFYSQKLKKYIHENDADAVKDLEELNLSGTQARRILQTFQAPPEWFMRPEISSIFLDALKNKEEVFVKEEIQKRDIHKTKKALVFWFSGLSGSGKTTIAESIKPFLEKDGFSVLVLDGDVVRARLHTRLGFTEQDIKKNNALIANLCQTHQDNYNVILVPIISPYAICREYARNLLGKEFYEVYFSADLETVVKRDVKGLYSKAKRKEISNLIGYSPGNIYEPPQNPDFVVDSMQSSIERTTNEFYEFIIKQLEICAVERL